MSERTTRILQFAIRLAIALILLAALTQFIDVSSTLKTMTELEPLVLLSAVFLALSRVPIGALRWSVLDPNPNAKFFDYVRYLMTNNFVNLFVPMVAGDAARAAHAVADGQQLTTAVSVFTDRVVGVFSILLFGWLALVGSDSFEGRQILLYLLSASIACVLLGFFVVTRFLSNRGDNVNEDSRVNRVLNLAGEIADFYTTHRTQVLRALLLCLPLHAIWFFLVWILASSLEIPISFWELTAYTSLVMVVTAIPVSLNGLGVRELSYAALFASQGIAAESAVALSLYQFVTMLTLGLLGLPFFIVGGSIGDDG